MSTVNRRNSAIATAVAVVLGLSACGGESSAEDNESSADAGTHEVQFMMFPGQGYRLPVLIADQKGFFEERGITISVVEQPAQLQGLQGLEATESQVGQVTVGTLGQGVQAGEEAKFFCGGIDVLQTMMVAPLDSDLPSTEDGATWQEVLQSFEGKTVGIQTPVGSGLHLILVAALEEAGVEDVNYVNLGGATNQVIAAMENGSVDVSQSTPSGTQYLEIEGRAKRLLYMSEGPKTYAENYGSAWVAPTAWLEENPELADEVCAALGEGLEFIQDPANKEEASAVLQEDTALEPEIADLVIDEAYGDYSIELPEDVLSNTFETYVELGILKAEPAPTYELLVDDHSGATS